MTAVPVAASPAEVVQRLPPVERLLVLLDFDGTLSEIVEDPDAAVPVRGAVDALRAVAARCPVALVSGRQLADLKQRLGADPPVTLAGSHGAEVELPDGAREALVDADTLTAVLDPLEADVRGLVDEAQGWLVERKPTSLAVHHRRVADPGETLEQVHERMAAAATEPPGFELLAGKAVLELRPAGVDKGGIVERLADDHAGHTVLMVGDDVTDEDAFRAAVARGGHAVLVADEPRPSAAHWRLDSPAEVVTLLRLLVG